MTTRKKSDKEFAKDLFDKWGGRIVAIDNYVNNSTPIEMECSKHEVFKMRPFTILSKRAKGCPKCGRESANKAIGNANRKSDLEFKKWVKIKFGVSIELKTSYINSKTPIEYLCPLGHSQIRTPAAINTSFNVCKKCKGNRSHDESLLKQVLHDREINSKIITKSTSRVWVLECLDHGIKYNTRIETLDRGSKSCPLCISQSYTYKRKPYLLGSRCIKIQGYEGIVIDYLLSKGIRPEDIHQDVPIIKYKWKGDRIHLPDLCVSSKKWVIEVKSVYTFGMTNYRIYQRVKSKALYASKGYKYNVYIVDKLNVIRLPYGWIHWDYNKTKDFINKKLENKSKQKQVKPK